MSERKNHWDRVYEGKSPLQVSWYKDAPTLSVKLIEQCVASRDAGVIDVGGGASTLVDYLLAAGYRNLAVLDISGRSLEYARHRLGDQAAAVEWFETDVTAFNPPRRFDVWHDRAVFHFLTAADDRRGYLDTLNQALLPGGFLVLAAFAIGGPSRCSGLDIVQYDAATLCGELGEGYALLDALSEEHVTPTGKRQKFEYFRFRKN